MAPLINSDVYVERLEALITKLTLNGIVINTSQIRNVYLNNIEWQNNHFHYVEEWFRTPQETTTPQTTAPTTTPSSSVTPPTTTTTTEPTDGANSIILSFGLLITCLTLNLFRK